MAADVDLTGRIAAEWREFNHEFIPILKSTSDITSNIAAGLACGMTWTVARGIEEGDTVLSPTGHSTYRVGTVTGPYEYAPGQELPHRRPVQWTSEEISRDAMTEALRLSLGSSGTVVAAREEFSDELAALIGGQHTHLISSGTQADGEDPVSFALEKHLEEFLVANWASTELGQTHDIFTDEDGTPVGQQYPTDTGPLDILAESKDGTELLVIELKRGRASDAVVGQILRYMGYVSEVDPAKSVRGIIIALEDDVRLTRALSMVPTVTFMRYEIKFKLISEAPSGD